MGAFLLAFVGDLLEDRCLDDITINNFLLLYHIKQIGHVLLWICSVTDHRSCQNVLTLWLQWVTKTEFSLQYQYNIKQTSDENEEKYQLGDYKLIQHQILQTNIIRTVGRQ